MNIYLLKTVSSIIKQVIVVVDGGSSTAATLSSVELLFLKDYEENNDGWVMGPKLPKSQFGTTVNAFQNTIIWTGGVGGPHPLYQLISPHGPWTEMSKTLRQQRSFHVSFLVPDDIVNCN